MSAALLRIFGQQVAELPMVATSREYQGRVKLMFNPFVSFVLIYGFKKLVIVKMVCRATSKGCLLVWRIFFLL